MKSVTFFRNNTLLPRYKDFLTIAVICIIYILCGKLGLYFAAINPSVSSVWIPSAIAVSALLFYGYRVWPAIFVAALIVNITTEGTLFICALIALGNTLEGLFAAYLVNRFAGGLRFPQKVSSFYKFIIMAVFFSTAVSATIGVGALLLGGLTTAGSFVPTWITWWLGDATGILIFAPAIVMWTTNVRFNSAKMVEFLILTGATLLLGLILIQYSILCSILVLPILVWLMLRFNPRGIATFIAFLSLTLVLTAPHQNTLGFSGGYTAGHYLFFLQLIVSVINFTFLPLSIFMYEQKKAKWKRDQVAFILESADNAVIGETLDGTITYWNKAAEKLYGYSADEALRQNISIIMPEEKKPELARIMKNVKAGIGADNLETLHINKDGNYIDVVVTQSPILDDEEEVIGISTMAVDITEKKKIERITREEILLAQQKNKEEFLTNVTHELRTPLAIIKGNVDVELKSKLNKITDLKDTVDVIDDEVKHLSKIVDKLTTIYRNKNNENPENTGYEKVILADIIKNVVNKSENFQTLKIKKNVTVEWKKMYRGFIWGDAVSLSKLFVRIMDNAFDYSRENSKIYVSIEKIDDTIRVEVEDSGIGISEEDLPHIFEEFYRNDKSRTRFENRTGLGLAVAKAITEAHKGTITAKSTLGKGSIFTLIFPLTK